MAVDLLGDARRGAGLSITQLAERARTSRPTLSAYEHGRVSPTLETLERILAAAGYQMRVEPIVGWRTVDVGRGRIAAVPDHLPRLDPDAALRTVELPIHLEWSRRARTVDLADRHRRARAYEVVLREGQPADILAVVDGVLLADVWDDLVVPRPIRVAWQPLIDDARGTRG
jgi:transcriptional regulator with XRE-family HTH domain